MPENTREITLDEAKKLYNSYEEGKAVLLSKKCRILEKVKNDNI